MLGFVNSFMSWYLKKRIPIIACNNANAAEVQKRVFKELLQEADLVKFAKSKPLSLKIKEDRKDAENSISNLKPKPIIEDDELE